MHEKGTKALLPVWRSAERRSATSPHRLISSENTAARGGFARLVQLWPTLPQTSGGESDAVFAPAMGCGHHSGYSCWVATTGWLVKRAVIALIDPVIQWSVDEASPSGLAYFGGSLWVACLRGQRLYRIPLGADGTLADPAPLFVGDFGRLRTVVTAPNGALWFTTSNRDGRGSPATATTGSCSSGPEPAASLRARVAPARLKRLHPPRQARLSGWDKHARRHLGIHRAQRDALRRFTLLIEFLTRPRISVLRLKPAMT